MSDDEAREGLAILDEALKAGDAHAAADATAPPTSATPRPAGRGRRRAGRRRGTAVFWLEDAPGAGVPRADRRDAAPTWRSSAAATAGCGPRCSRSAATPARRVVLLEAQHRRVGGVRPQRRLLRGQPHPRRGERPVPLARRVRRARAARARRTSTPSRPTCASSAWTASSSAPARWPSPSRSTRSSGCARSPRLPRPRRRTRARSTARCSSPASGTATTARWCTRPGWPASWPGSPRDSASRSTSTPGHRPRRADARRRSSVAHRPAARSPPTGSRSRPTSSRRCCAAPGC